MGERTVGIDPATGIMVSVIGTGVEGDEYRIDPSVGVVMISPDGDGIVTSVEDRDPDGIRASAGGVGPLSDAARGELLARLQSLRFTEGT